MVDDDRLGFWPNFLFQVQLEMIDMKIGKQVGELRDEVKQNIDLQVVNLGTELKSIQTQLDRLRGDDDSAMSRTEALEMMRSVAADMLAVEGEGESLSLEDVRAVARQIVLTELQKHTADGIGRPDYALASGGGVVVDHSEGFFVGRGGKWSMAALSLLPGVSQKHPLANKLLEPSFGEPGQCLPLKGSNVFVEVSLRTSIIPTAITLEHVSKVGAIHAHGNLPDPYVCSYICLALLASSLMA
jgi:SUN domain-containing protein 1/2